MAIKILDANLLEPAGLLDAADTSRIVAVAFIDLHLSTALARRASMQITGKPSRLSWVDSHVAGGQISRPIRTSAFDLTNAEITSGSESTTPSRATEHKVL